MPALLTETSSNRPTIVIYKNREQLLGRRLTRRGLTAAHLNNARHHAGNQIFVTLFHHGRAVMVQRDTGAAREVLCGLLNPHGFEPGWDGEHIVTDTRRGQLIFLDENFDVKSVLVMDACAPVESRDGLGEWLQNVLHLDRGLYAAVDIHRSCIWLFETATQRYRKIEVSHDWAVQSRTERPGCIRCSVQRPGREPRLAAAGL